MMLVVRSMTPMLAVVLLVCAPTQGQQYNSDARVRANLGGDFGVTFAESNDGLRIRGTNDGSFAARNGFRQDDVILSFDGDRIRNQDDFRRGWSQMQNRNGRVPIVVRRDGSERTLYVSGDDFRSRRDNRQGNYDQDFGMRLRQNGDQWMVRGVTDDGPAARIGLRSGDRLISVDGERIDDQGQVREILSETRNNRVPVIIVRNGERRTLYYSAGDSRQYSQRGSDESGQNAWLGVSFDTRYEDHAVVRQVNNGGPADRAGVEEGDWITSLNNQDVGSRDDVSRILDRMQPGQQVEMEVARRVAKRLTVRLDERDSNRSRETRTYRGEQEQGYDDDRRSREYYQEYRERDDRPQRRERSFSLDLPFGD